MLPMASLLLPLSVTLGDVNGPWGGGFLAHLKHSAFCLEYYLSLGRLTLMLLEKKVPMGSGPASVRRMLGVYGFLVW